MDDVKLYAKPYRQLETLLQAVYGFTKEINIKLDFEKRVKVTLDSGS